jgi:hypothetical protein
MKEMEVILIARFFLHAAGMERNSLLTTMESKKYYLTSFTTLKPKLKFPALGLCICLNVVRK